MSEKGSCIAGWFDLESQKARLLNDRATTSFCSSMKSTLITALVCFPIVVVLFLDASHNLILPSAQAHNRLGVVAIVEAHDMWRTGSGICVCATVLQVPSILPLLDE